MALAGCQSFAARLWTRFYLLLGLDELEEGHLSEAAANRMRRGQIRGSIEQMRVFLAANTFFAPALSLQAWNSGVNALVILWTVAMLTFSWALFFSWNSTYKTDGNRKDLRRFVLETYANSGLWALGMALFYPVVSGDQKAVLACIMAGSLALGTVGFSRTPAAAFSYLGVQTTASFLVALGTGIATGSGTDYLIAFLALAAGGGVFNAVLERAKSSMRAFNDRESLAEKSEVVDLLLKDYEEQATEWLWQTNGDLCIRRAPQQVLDMLGVSPGETTSLSLLEAISARVSDENCPDLERLQTAFSNKVDFHDVLLLITDVQNGARRWIMMRGRPQFENDTFSGFRGIFADATAMVEAKKQVEFLATHDSLTGIHNRNSLQDRLAKLDPENDHAAVFLIDLDGFKQVNDSYGHGVGDELLQVVAERLCQTISANDFVARLGGDEFLVLVKSAQELMLPELVTMGDHLVQDLSQPYLIDHLDLSLSASIGLARFPFDSRDGEELLVQVDLALYAAKNGGRNQCRTFVEDMQKGLQKRLIVTERLKKAIVAEQIVPFYQPQYSLIDGGLVGFEALARWADAELGFVGPDIFIPVAEQTGLIGALGEQLLKRSCLDAMTWQSCHSGGVCPMVCVNISPIQFEREDVAQIVRRVLSETGLDAARLEIEITEGVLISDAEKTAATLLELTDMGVTIALDDFGTGYSSLSYLRALPLNRLKIDRSFVRDMHERSAQSIVNAIVQLGSNLGLSVIAEGVETEEQRQALARMGCQDGQGYLFSAAVPAHEVNALTTASLDWWRSPKKRQS
ncbi:MAG: EAL domain-containing protein [Paracoccaceae bacterium]|nr:EAL domain-containing protein [Paracoccaceae bacterium]